MTRTKTEKKNGWPSNKEKSFNLCFYNQDAELSKEAADADLLEGFLEQLLKEECLDKIDGEIEQTKKDDLEDEVTRTMEYKEHNSEKNYNKKSGQKRGGDAASVMSGEANSVRYNVKLPKLVIDKYTGDVSHWQYFWGQFEMTVYQNPNLNKTAKFSHLMSYLTGAAANVVWYASDIKALR